MNVEFLNEIVMMLDAIDDYLAAVQFGDDSCSDDAYMQSVYHLNSVYYYLSTNVEQELIDWQTDVCGWLNAYVSYRDYWDKIVTSNEVVIETEGENLQLAIDTVERLMFTTNRLKGKIIESLNS